jgi:hypothetical protein
MTINTTAIRETIAKELKLEGFTPEEQQEIIDMLQENIIIKVNNDIFQLLDEADRDTFVTLGEQNDSTLFQAFLEQKVPDINELVTKVARYVIEDFKNHTA